MNNIMKILSAMVLVVGMLMPMQANATVKPTAVPGVVLPYSGGHLTPMAVAYHPTFNRYYSGDGGTTGVSAWVWGASGAALGSATPGVDNRGIYYNPNTGFIESVSYNAGTGNTLVSGIMSLNLDIYGDYLGTNTQLLAGPIAALGSVQTMPSYDPATDLMYANQGNGSINVLNRTTGVAQPSITLDLAAAGVVAADVSTYSIGFTGRAGEELVIYDSTNSRVLVFDLTGAFVGASVLPTPVGATVINTAYGTSYANGLFFVYDGAAGVNGSFLGFRVFAPAPAAAGGGGGCALNAQAGFDPLMPVLMLLAMGLLYHRKRNV